MKNVFEPPRILIAGIGNVSLGDDGFGVAVSEALSRENLPDSVRVAGFGIRGFDLAYAMQCGYDTAILVDAYPGEQQPGTISVIELDLHDGATETQAQSLAEPRTANPMHVLRMVASMNGPLRRVLLVGCVPMTFSGEEGSTALSEPVAAAVPDAVRVTMNLVERILDEVPNSKAD